MLSTYIYISIYIYIYIYIMQSVALTVVSRAVLGVP